jgi:alpha-tubulin suppressor-like RCC1 family protein
MVPAAVRTSSGLLSGVVDVSAGYRHTCALRDDTTVWCWGDNTNGELGDDTHDPQPNAVEVVSTSGTGHLAGAAQISAGYHTTCARMTDGTATCWGDDAFGELGDGSATTDSSIPVVVGNESGSGALTDIAEIRAGYRHTCARLATAVARCWGDNTYGELGDGTMTSHPRPVAVTTDGSAALTDVAQVAVGLGAETCARLVDGSVSCFGRNNSGQLATGGTVGPETCSTDACSTLPVKAQNTAGSAALLGVVEVEVGADDACARLITGTIECWGLGTSGQLGNSDFKNTALPVTVVDSSGTGLLSGTTRIAAGSFQTCALLAAHTVTCWGNDLYAQLGDGSLGNSSTPVVVSDGGIPVAGPPDPPTNVRAVASPGVVTVSWTRPSSNGSPITRFTITSSPPGVNTTAAGAATHTTISSLAPGRYSFTVSATNALGTGPRAVSNLVTVKAVAPPGRSGYWLVGRDGRVYAFGSAAAYGSALRPTIAIAARRDGTGYWTTDTAGTVDHFGRAAAHGGNPALRPGEIVSTIAATPSGNGYWLFSNRGRAFNYGDARRYGDMSAVRLNGPIVASIATPTGRGYYMVASDGGIFSFGDARFHGSMGGARLNQPIVGMSPTLDNRGYWLIASDGGVFAFSAPFRGSMGSRRLNQPIIALVPYGNGYLMAATDGGIFDFSNKPFGGSLGGHPPTAPIVGVAAFSL